MRRLFAVLLVGCASGHAVTGVPDGDVTPPIDAAAVDAPADAAVTPVDAAPPVDALADAPPAQMPDAYQCQVMTKQLLVNPTFDVDAAGTGWVQQPIAASVKIITDYDGATEHSAPYKAWLGGASGLDLGKATVTDMLYQDVMVPAGTTQLRLTGMYWVATNETTTTTAFDNAQLALVETNGTPIETVIALTNLTTTTTWTAIDKTFTANQSGKTVRLRFTSSNDIDLHTNFFFDTFALTATYCQ